MRLLWIDDDIWLLEPLVESLEKANVIVETAQTFTEAREKIRKSSFDAFLVDLIMPHGDSFDEKENRVLPEHQFTGLRVVMEIRKVDKLSPIFILSVVGDERIEQHLRQYQVKKIFRKPFLPSDLKRELLNID